MVYQPLASHPLVENKDGNAVTFNSALRMTQLDDGTTEVEMGYHLNFGGQLPKALVNGFILPDVNRGLSHNMAYYACALDLGDLTKEDGKLLGEILVHQIKAARKRGG